MDVRLLAQMKDLPPTEIGTLTVGSAQDFIDFTGRLQSQTVASDEELSALPFGSVVMDDDGDVYRSGMNNGQTAWWQAGPQGMFRTVALPAVVLWQAIP